ncbi:DUF2953 domain-containing protein [Clostridium uliginosum]|uniref:DUF2953 domain-containing protein n=1 Tax=Clostridium uliginosum TaxID=119641 RepID=A0A1I1HH49_9CLOT|nr:DUF2953 domain-containing protein [Clostridium uliginosum]SFC23161.1 Protein of unknown function [Clostridium uliginosum]
MKLFPIFLIIFLIILIIILIPFPLKISIYFSNEDYYIKLYKFVIVSKEKSKNESLKKKGKKENQKNPLFNTFKKLNKKYLINKLYHTKFKPWINLKGQLDYSLGDAAHTAVSYGVLSQLCPLIYLIFNILFKSHKFKFNMNPIFKDEILVKFEISSIIFFSIANIINILIIVCKCMIYSKEVDPL